MSLNSWIATKINALNASPIANSLIVHSGWGFIIIEFLQKALPLSHIIIPYVAITATKEYYWDKHFESPPQAFKDSSVDFGGWSLGALLALVLSYI